MPTGKKKADDVWSGRADPRVKLWGNNRVFSLLALCIIERITSLIKCDLGSRNSVSLCWEVLRVLREA